MQIMPLWSQHGNYAVEIIDTRDLTVTQSAIRPFEEATMEEQTYSERAMPTFFVELPTKPYLAVRFTVRY